jgi:hypothetical protein
MMDLPLEERAKLYAKLVEIDVFFQRPLGSGTDGSVWKTTRGTAVKALARQPNYINELECYKRFAAAEVTEIDGFAVPHLVNSNDEL